MYICMYAYYFTVAQPAHGARHLGASVSRDSRTPVEKFWKISSLIN